MLPADLDLCGSCGAGSPAGRHFCTNCGLPLTEAGAAIHAVDPLAATVETSPATDRRPTLRYPPLAAEPGRWNPPTLTGRPPGHSSSTAPAPVHAARVVPSPRGLRDSQPPVLGPGPLHPAPLTAAVPTYPVGPAYRSVLPPHLIPVYSPPRSKVSAALLAAFLGMFGTHRFYVGDNGSGAAMLVLFLVGFVTFGLTWLVTGIWALVDFIVICSGGFRDSYGRPLR